MRFWYRFFVALSVVLTFATPGGAQGPSALRQLVELADQDNWLSIGRLNVTGQGFCTATLVASDLVMTAAHCIVDKRTLKVVSPDRVHFLAGFRKGDYAAHSTAASVSVATGFDRELQTLGSDIALIKLSEPMGAKVPPMALSADARVGDAIAAVSYSIDRSQIQSHQPDCLVLRVQHQILYTSCEGVPGVSGAPIFKLKNGVPRLVGVASSVASRAKEKIPRGNLIAVIPSPNVVSQLLQDLGMAAVLADGSVL